MDMNPQSPLEKRVSEAMSSGDGGDATVRAFRRILGAMKVPMEDAPVAVVARAMELGQDLPQPASWLAVLTGSQFRAVGARSAAAMEQHQFSVEGRPLRVLVDGKIARGQFEAGWEVACREVVVELDAEGRFEVALGERRLIFTSDEATFSVELPDAP